MLFPLNQIQNHISIVCTIPTLAVLHPLHMLMSLLMKKSTHILSIISVIAAIGRHWLPFVFNLFMLSCILGSTYHKDILINLSCNSWLKNIGKKIKIMLTNKFFGYNNNSNVALVSTATVINISYHWIYDYKIWKVQLKRDRIRKLHDSNLMTKLRFKKFRVFFAMAREKKNSYNSFIIFAWCLILCTNFIGFISNHFQSKLNSYYFRFCYKE